MKQIKNRKEGKKKERNSYITYIFAWFLCLYIFIMWILKQEILPKFSSQAPVPLSHQPPLKKFWICGCIMLSGTLTTFQSLLSKKEMTSEHTQKKKSGALTASFDKEKKKD